MLKIKDMPKLESPFVRKVNDKGHYVVTPEVNLGYEWVFTEADVQAQEKLDGTNVSIVIENHEIKKIYNRTSYIPFFSTGKSFIVKGLLESFERGYMDSLCDGQHFGELIGEGVNGNPLKISGNLWIPFETYCSKHLTYKSWHEYPKTFENIENWFKKPVSEGGIFSLFARKRGLVMKPEGIVFHRSNGDMCKLRLDMFEFYYEQNPNAKQHGHG